MFSVFPRIIILVEANTAARDRPGLAGKEKSGRYFQTTGKEGLVLAHLRLWFMVFPLAFKKPENWITT
jgi:hypothetical protein